MKYHILKENEEYIEKYVFPFFKDLEIWSPVTQVNRKSQYNSAVESATCAVLKAGWTGYWIGECEAISTALSLPCHLQCSYKAM
jgi:hypothetical protein